MSISGWGVCSTSVRLFLDEEIENISWDESMADSEGIGYLAWEYPTNRLLQRLPLGKYSAACIIIWGLILSCFAGVKSFAGAIAIRLFLGVFEAAVTPGFALITSQVCRNRVFGCINETIPC
jgi:MFS family permease